MDDDGSKCLNFEEFAKGIRETGLDCTDEDARVMFEHFDKDGSGTVNIDEFLMAIRVSRFALNYHKNWVLAIFSTYLFFNYSHQCLKQE